MSKSKHAVNQEKKTNRRSPSRLVTLSDEQKARLVVVAKERAQEVMTQPPPIPKANIQGVIRGLVTKLKKEDESLTAEAIAAGIVEALQPAIMGAHFIAPSSMTITRHVKSALSAKRSQEGVVSGAQQ